MIGHYTIGASGGTTQAGSRKAADSGRLFSRFNVEPMGGHRPAKAEVQRPMMGRARFELAIFAV